MAACVSCGKKIGFLEGGGGRCGTCFAVHFANAKGDTSESLQVATAEAAARRTAIDAILVTTEMQPDIHIRKRLTIVTAEVAYGMNVFKDLFAGVRNIVGGRSEAIQNTMRDARETVLYELKREAHALGANAVIAVDLDYTQIGDGGWNMVLLVASGTAVVADIGSPQ